ncbi:hypothetical protein HHK36_018827 [Tetracentron sinense]|uniref:Uncharacterized protein n=1 Tax=Tetracentron sinense TaxID=13715 RepID=A0A834YSY2_TETSI|nr:hypothetical protein HHK36_018827 [Tetracentron sinense]
MQLANLTFLSVLNLSYNNLVGRIPQGTQFQTFTEASFEGNGGLCGVPLTKNCTEAEVVPQLEAMGSTSMIGFDWKIMLNGLGFGAGAGMPATQRQLRPDLASTASFNSRPSLAYSRGSVSSSNHHLRLPSSSDQANNTAGELPVHLLQSVETQHLHRLNHAGS